VLSIDGRCCPVLLADRVDVLGVVKRGEVRRAHIVAERVRGSAPSTAESVLDHGVRARFQQALRKRFGLSEQGPRPEPESQPGVRSIPRDVDREHVEDREAVYALRMVQRRAIGHATPAIVPSEVKALKSEAFHDVDHVIGHASLRVGRVIDIRGWAAALPVATQVRAHNREVARERRRDLTPHQMRLREAVKQQHRRPSATMAHEDPRVSRIHDGSLESVQRQPPERFTSPSSLGSPYTAALRHHDIDGMLALLTEDATWSMPPLPSWFRGHEAIAAFLADGPFTQRWRHRPTRANGQLAIGCYSWDETAGTHVAYALDVLELRGDRIASIVAFIGGERFAAFGLPPDISS
jgi:hypothetical protein